MQGAQIGFQAPFPYPVPWMRPLDNILTTTAQVLGVKVLDPLQCPDLRPAYTTEIPDSVPSEDMEYLVGKGVFDVPNMALRNELLVTFVHNVHPYMPLLDISPFVEAIESNGQRGKVSLLLFHAVMFSSAAFIEPGNRDADWLVSRKQSRQGFYEKAKVPSQTSLAPTLSHLSIADSV